MSHNPSAQAFSRKRHLSHKPKLQTRTQQKTRDPTNAVAESPALRLARASHTLTPTILGQVLQELRQRASAKYLHHSPKTQFPRHRPYLTIANLNQNLAALIQTHPGATILVTQDPLFIVIACQRTDGTGPGALSDRRRGVEFAALVVRA